MLNERDQRILATDKYQLTMADGYLECNKNEEAVYDQFVRQVSEKWGYHIALGIDEAVDFIVNFKPTKEDEEYLARKGLYGPKFLEYLHNFAFKGDIFAVREGTPVAPDTPLIEVVANRIDAQVIETGVLARNNFQIRIAGRASRCVVAARGKPVVDFGLRRADGIDAGLRGSRAAYIAGFSGTSNLEADCRFGIKDVGTMAHSWVMAYQNPDQPFFLSELESFRDWARTHPDRTTLLIDTYNIELGAVNAAVVAKELEARGFRLGAVRIDSGDLVEGSKLVRRVLDSFSLQYVKIVASNDLDEYIIYDLEERGAVIDIYGVGTRMISGFGIGNVPGVWKLVEDENGGPKVKFSSSKVTNPGRKQVFRIEDKEGNYLYDELALFDEKRVGRPLLEKVVAKGKRIVPERSLEEIRSYSLESIAKLPVEVRKIRDGKVYELKKSAKMQELIEYLRDKYETEMAFKDEYIEFVRAKLAVHQAVVAA